MATNPYISGAGNISQVVNQFRKAFPSNISSETIKKFGIASNNESYVINVLQFIGVVDTEGNKTPAAAKAFSHHKKEEFEEAFGALVKKAYSSLFDLHGEDAWDLDSDMLITYFRQSDQTSSTIGRRQANVFKVLSALSGHGEIPEAKPKKPNSTVKASKPKVSSKIKEPVVDKPQGSNNQNTNLNSGFGLSVRVEINLPADGTKETYDNIFKSIKENLLGG